MASKKAGKSTKNTEKSSSTNRTTKPTKSSASDVVLYEDRKIRISIDSLQYILTLKEEDDNWYFTSLTSLIDSLVDYVTRTEQMRLRKFVIDLENVKKYATMVVDSLNKEVQHVSRNSD